MRLLLASVIFLATLRRALSTDSSAPDSASPRADPRDYREYLGHEGVGDASSTFMAEHAFGRPPPPPPQTTLTDRIAFLLSQTVILAVAEIRHPFWENRIEECMAKGARAGVVMKQPYASDWARLLEFHAFLLCFARYLISKTPYYGNPMPDDAPTHVQLQYTDAASRAIGACYGTLPATTVHRPAVVGREGAAPLSDPSHAGADLGPADPLLQYRRPAVSRPVARLHPWWAWVRRLGPGLRREMRPAVRRAGAAWQSGARAIEDWE
ncbi:MAG: hypothetical protein M1826_003582 [Phylliscum demangeonii]|nr:MAG: hypothetical protein M1826_003582 [Phylliscum demangeonii]